MNTINIHREMYYLYDTHIFFLIEYVYLYKILNELHWHLARTTTNNKKVLYIIYKTYKRSRIKSYSKKTLKSNMTNKNH